MIEYIASNPFSTVGLIAYAVGLIYVTVKGMKNG